MGWMTSLPSEVRHEFHVAQRLARGIIEMVSREREPVDDIEKPSSPKGRRRIVVLAKRSD